VQVGIAELDLRQFNAIVRDLARISGADFKTALRVHTTKVLELCLKRTPGKTGNAVREKARLRVEKPARYVDLAGTKVVPGPKVPRPMTTPFLQTLTGTRGGIAGGQWYVGRNRAGTRVVLHPTKMVGNAKFSAMQAIQSSLQQQLSPKAAEAVAAIGSLKKSWLQIADRLGLDLKVAGFVRKARGRYDDGARSAWHTDGAAFFAECVNTNNQLVRRYNAAAIVQGALQTRAKAFAIEMQKGVFDDVKTRAARYPGVFTTG
jgi:hypothetical protein